MAGTECVKAPQEMNVTPVKAMVPTVSSVTFPEASSSTSRSSHTLIEKSEERRSRRTFENIDRLPESIGIEFWTIPMGHVVEHDATDVTLTSIRLDDLLDLPHLVQRARLDFDRHRCRSLSVEISMGAFNSSFETCHITVSTEIKA